MAQIKAELSEKDSDFRNFILSANLWKVIFRVCTPLAIYQGLLQIFKILDTVIASHISADAVSSVAYLSQINFFISAVGGGLAVGSGMKISEAYGAGDYVLVKKRVSSLFAICFIISLAVLAIIPFTDGFLRLSGTPETMISIGSKYFIVELVSTVLSFFNTIYIAIERARGNSKLILRINMLILIVKFVLNILFVYVFKGGVVSIAAATLISQAVFLLITIYNMRAPDNLFGFSIHAVSFRSLVIKPMLSTSAPVTVEKAAFAYGKLIINSMSTDYGDHTVGALGISNTIGGIATNLQNGIQEGGAAVISQNIGAGNSKRAVEAFFKLMAVCVAIGLIFMLLTLWQLDFISGLFSSGDEEFRQLIAQIYRYEALGAVTLGINAAAMALLYGFGYTKITLILNVARVFVFRIPVLWYLQNFTDIGSSSVGIVMMVSNISVGLLSAVVSAAVVRKIRKSMNENKAV